MTQPFCFPDGRQAEQATELAAELRRAFIPYRQAGRRSGHLFLHHQQTRLMQSDRFNVLHRRGLRHRFEVCIESSMAHACFARQARDIQRPGVIAGRGGNDEGVGSGHTFYRWIKACGAVKSAEESRFCAWLLTTRSSMDRLDCDRMFVAVLEVGSFAGAALRLGTSSGQASKLVSRLERELGVQLFKRSTRALSPTDIGLAYYERVKSLLDEFDALDDAVRDRAGAPGGQLKISAPVTFGTASLTPVLVAFARQFPLIELDVSFADRAVNIVDEGFDMAIRIGKLSNSSLIARRLGDVRVIIAAAPDYLQQHGTPQHWRDLAQHQCLIDTNFRDPWNWPFEDPPGKLVNTPVQGRLRFSNTEACLQAAVAGLGIARLPGFIAAPALKNSGVVPLLENYEIAPLGLFALYPPARYLTHKARLLIDFLADHFQRHPPT